MSSGVNTRTTGSRGELGPSATAAPQRHLEVLVRLGKVFELARQRTQVPVVDRAGLPARLSEKSGPAVE